MNEKVQAYMDVMELSKRITPSMKTFKKLGNIVAKDPTSFLKFNTSYMHKWGWYLYLNKLFV